MVDIWRVGIVPEPIHQVLAPQGLDKSRVVWLPDQGSFRYVADPFGLRHGDLFTVLVEFYDYRVKRGEIHYYSYDAAWKLKQHGVALKQDFHLSYPQLIQSDGDIFMLPEAYESGRLTLYRAIDFPLKWQPVTVLLNEPAVDATIVHHQQRWWMFHALYGPGSRDLREMHVAFADALTGPWQNHPQNPVRTGLDSSRPGGSPFVHLGQLHLPAQDCMTGYGSALNLLRIDRLSPDDFSASIVRRLSPEGWLQGHADGLHTLSDGGSVTLIDVKGISHSPMRRVIKLQHWLRQRFNALDRLWPG
ncbi:MAG: glycosyl hydrolase family 43 [Mesorhizobium sp.]